jgi:hypothetical protein
MATETRNGDFNGLVRRNKGRKIRRIIFQLAPAEALDLPQPSNADCAGRICRSSNHQKWHS